MNNLGQTFIYIWAVAMLAMFISGIIFIVNTIKKKDRKIIKKLFVSSVIIAIACFVLYGITSPVTRCKHEYTTILDQAATCTEDGKKEQHCPLCDFTKKETFKATGHKMKTKSKIEPTYDTEGEQVDVCSVCGYEEITKIDMLVKETTTEATTNKETTTKSTTTETTTTTKPTTTKPTTTKEKSDKEIANEISNDIANIGEVTLDKEKMILDIKERYDQLTKKQKRKVKDYKKLENCLSELKVLHEFEYIKSNPTYNLTKSDLAGLWEEAYPDDERTEYYYFNEYGYVYYISSKETPQKSDFTSNYRISLSFEFDNYDIETQTKNGNFVCAPVNETFNFSVKSDENKKLTMVVSCDGSTQGTGEGTYKKTDAIKTIYINKGICIECGETGNYKYTNPATHIIEYYCYTHYNEIINMISEMEEDVGKGSYSKHICEQCSKEGTHTYYSFTGQTEYYCTQHYEELQSMLNSFGLD